MIMTITGIFVSKQLTWAPGDKSMAEICLHISGAWNGTGQEKCTDITSHKGWRSTGSGVIGIHMAHSANVS